MKGLITILFFHFALLVSAGQQMGPDPITSLNKKLMLELINELRAKGCRCGEAFYKPAPPLVWNSQLEEAAALHSKDMFKKAYFSHIEANGTNAGARLDKTGYVWKAYGENIGMGYANEKQVMEGWIKSVEHCKNMMNPKYTEVGAGRAGSYWTQDFGSR